MTGFQYGSLPREKFLTMAINLLHQALIDVGRSEAKQLFRQVLAGHVVPLASVRLADESSARFDLSLSHSEFQGTLNYSAFRDSLVTLVGNAARALREERELTVFNALNGGSAMIFGVTAVTRVDDVTNVMVLAADTAGRENATVLQLMYLDPAQFAAPAADSRQA